jgi:hypothetical protein
MSTQVYKVLEPLTGAYLTYPTCEECIRGLTEVAYRFYLSHVHGTPYSIVTENDDGTETWYAVGGEKQPLGLNEVQVQELTTAVGSSLE